MTPGWYALFSPLFIPCRRPPSLPRTYSPCTATPGTHLPLPCLPSPPKPSLCSQNAHISKVDGAQSYIKWAVSHGFAVIDINVPQHITINDEDSPEYHDTDVEYASTMTDVARKEGEKLAQYLWENYVEPWDFPGGIFLMGAGTAFHALAKLVSENGTFLIPTHPIILSSFLFTCRPWSETRANTQTHPPPSLPLLSFLAQSLNLCTPRAKFAEEP